jgi:hypothetical protein
MGRINNTGKQRFKERVFSKSIVIAALISGIFGLLIALISNWDKIVNNPSQTVQTAVPSNQKTSSIPSPTASNSGNSQNVGNINAHGNVNIHQEINNKK